MLLSICRSQLISDLEFLTSCQVHYSELFYYSLTYLGYPLASIQLMRFVEIDWEHTMTSWTLSIEGCLSYWPLAKSQIKVFERFSFVWNNELIESWNTEVPIAVLLDIQTGLGLASLFISKQVVDLSISALYLPYHCRLRRRKFPVSNVRISGLLAHTSALRSELEGWSLSWGAIG